MKHLVDTHRHKGKRKILISELEENGISDQRILSAFDAIPRHFFFDSIFEDQAYSNIAFPIGDGQTISHPYTVAFQTELLEVQKGEKVLEIGTGSAFQTCILCKLGAKVFSIERHLSLHKKAKEMIDFFNLSAKLFYGDGYQGSPAYAPFDKILVTCGAPEIPNELVKQLKIGGIMVIPVGEGAEQKMLKIVKLNEGEVSLKEYGTFKFVPMLEHKVNSQK
ncbi:MAG: protein-L-isoaspartate(D-aspartate) O-methyltransferase [Flavobacteriales bacterium]|nr:protein-L-isoaspartate(D-aspartate) O-methyltransferase [Flavobacteriales bacterium]